MFPREWRRARDFRASSCLPLIMSHLDNQLPMSAVRRLWGVPWRFGEQECQADKWDSGEHLQSQLDLSAQFGDSGKSTHRNPPFDLSAGSSFGTAVSYPSSDESSDTNEQLEGSRESPTIGRMGCGSELFQQAGRRHTNFRLVHWSISIVISDIKRAYEVLVHRGNRYPFQQRTGPPASYLGFGMLSVGHLQ
jgi:hypothetical protein